TIASARFATDIKSIRALTGGDALAFLVSGKLSMQATFTYADVLAGSVAALDQVLGMTGAAAYKINLGANVAANLTASDDFRLVFTRGTELEIAVEVQKSASSSAAATASLGAQVGFDNTAQLAGLLDSYLIGRLGTRYQDFKGLLGKLSSVSNLTQLDPSEQALAQAIATRLGLAPAQDQLAALKTRLDGAEAKLSAGLLKVASTQIKLVFTAGYTRIASSQAILRFETSADSLAPLLNGLLLGNLTGVTARLVTGDPAFLLREYMESREVQTGRSFGVALSIGEWAAGSTFTVNEDRKEQKSLQGVRLSYDGRRTLQSSWNKDRELYAFELAAAMDHYAPAPKGADFAFLINLSWMWNAVLDANLLHTILDLANVWRVVAREEAAGLRTALLPLLGKRVQAELELRVSDAGVRQLVLFPAPTFEAVWVKAMAEALPPIFFGDHFLRENVA